MPRAAFLARRRAWRGVRPLCGALGAAVALLAGPAVAGAQTDAVRYLPIESWAAPYVEHLIRTGVLRGLDPLTRPLRRADVARALAAADTSGLNVPTRAMLRLLGVETADPADHAARWLLEPQAGYLAASEAGRWTRRPAAAATRVFPQVQLGALLELPHVALVSTPGIDNRLKYDPGYLGKEDRFVAGRNGAAYVLASWRYADLAFGNVDRNWGPVETEGLLISPSPFGTEQLMLRLGPQHLRIELLVQQLDPLAPWDSVQPVQRWLVGHRLVVQTSDRFTFSLDESTISTGPGLPWRYLNPVTPGLLTQYDAAPAPNSLLSAAFAWRARGAAQIFGLLLVDDIQIDHRSQGDREPPGYGLTIGASGALVGATGSWTAWYTRVTNLTYRTAQREQQYTANGLGIGRNNADHDEALLRVTNAPAQRVLVGGELSYRRQGEGDMRSRYPAASAFADSLTFLTGVVQRTATVAASASLAPHAGVAASAWAGYNVIANADHMDGTRRSRWVCRLQLNIHGRIGGALP